MAEVKIYTTQVCPFCVRAKNLLSGKGVSFEEIRVDGDDTMRDELVKLSGGRRTVPQIFIDGTCYGGFDELADLDRKGELDGLLGL